MKQVIWYAFCNDWRILKFWSLLTPFWPLARIADILKRDTQAKFVQYSSDDPKSPSNLCPHENVMDHEDCSSTITSLWNSFNLGCVYHLSQVKNTFQYPLSKRVKTKERRFQPTNQNSFAFIICKNHPESHLEILILRQKCDDKRTLRQISTDQGQNKENKEKGLCIALRLWRLFNLCEVNLGKVYCTCNHSSPHHPNKAAICLTTSLGFLPAPLVVTILSMWTTLWFDDCSNYFDYLKNFFASIKW